jgi:hypothetical protein
MRKVVNFDNNTDIVDVNTITDSSSVGVKWENGRKNIIVKKNDNEFGAMDLSHLSLSYAWTRPTKREYIIQALRQNPEVFVFATKEELLTWFIKVD